VTRHAGCPEGRFDGDAEGAREPARGLVLLGEDPVGQLGRRRIVRALRDAPEQLVGGDLQVLERVREGGELVRRVRLRLEEQAPVERARAEGRIFQRRG
jgi:hypothetical protein